MKILKCRVWNNIGKEFLYFDTPIIEYYRRQKVRIIFKNMSNKKSCYLGGYGDIELYLRKDYQNEDIYEGDIIQVDTLEDAGTRINTLIGEVFYCEEAMQFLLKNKDGEFHINYFGIIKKIGNKYELLQQETNYE